MLIIAIKFDSPGYVLFEQKSGIQNSNFNILKFYTVRIDISFDMPQIINIFSSEMSIIGLRPALWNQYDLIEERDKYRANNVPVGLTKGA